MRNELCKFPFLKPLGAPSLLTCTDNLTFYVTQKIESIRNQKMISINLTITCIHLLVSLSSYLTSPLSIWIKYSCFSLRTTLHLCSRSISFTYSKTLLQKFYLHFLEPSIFYYLLNHPHWHTNEQKSLPLQEIKDKRPTSFYSTTFSFLCLNSKAPWISGLSYNSSPLIH